LKLWPDLVHRRCCGFQIEALDSNHSDLDVSAVKKGESSGVVEAGNRPKKRGRKTENGREEPLNHVEAEIFLASASAFC